MFNLVRLLRLERHLHTTCEREGKEEARERMKRGREEERKRGREEERKRGREEGRKGGREEGRKRGRRVNQNSEAMSILIHVVYLKSKHFDTNVVVCFTTIAGHRVYEYLENSV